MTDAAVLAETKSVLYCDGYKYQTRNAVFVKTDIHPDEDIVAEQVTLKKDGWLIVGKYFAWDGPSGPTIDDKTNMRGSLAHDALYYLMRIGLLDIKWREAADRVLLKCMLQDGAAWVKARCYYTAVKLFGKKCATPEGGRKIRRAP